MKNIILILPILLILLTACSSNGEEKESITKSWSPKTFFNQAKRTAETNTTEEAIDVYEQLQASYPGSKYAIQSKLEIIFLLYQRKEYNRAIRLLNSYIKLYSDHVSTPYAYYLRGVISENKSRSILDRYDITDNAERDISSVRYAFNYYIQLIRKFPQTKYAKDAKTRLVRLRNILARHELYVAIFYTKNQAQIAAINRCKFIIEKYPNTPSVPAALHLMAHNYDLINAKVLAKDTRRVLKNNYPIYKAHYSL